MKKFELTDEFKDDFRHAVRRYFKEVEQARERGRKVEAFGKPCPFNSWRYDLAVALQSRAYERVSRSESRIIALIQSLSDGKPVPAIEAFNDSIVPIASYPAVECLGMVFAIVGEEQNFVVRPAWMHVTVD